MVAVVCIATGPSLTKEDCAKARKAEKVIAINDAYLLAPDADVLYACDQSWWRHHIDEVRKVFAGELWTQYESGKTDSDDYQFAVDNGIKTVPGQPGAGLGRGGIIHYGNNSGYQAIGLAWLLYRPERISLLGYDMGLATDGKRHFFGDHPGAMNALSNYPMWITKFDALAADLAAEGVDVVNCTPTTALKVFRRGTL